MKETKREAKPMSTATPVLTDKLSGLQKLTDSMNRKATKANPNASKVAFFAEGNEHLLDLGVISTGNPAIDMALADNNGVGGIPRGSVCTIAGQEGAGKTCLALDIIAHNHKTDPNFVALYIYLEGNDFPWHSAIKAGVDKKRLLIINAQENGEKTLDLMISYLWDWENKTPRNLIDMVVIDSVAAAVPEAELDTAQEQGLAKATVALQARMMSKAFRIISGTGCLGKCALLLINQYRTDVSPYSGGPVLPGGKAILYYSKIIMDVRQPRSGWMTKGTGDKKEVYGHTIEGKISKNNTGMGKPHTDFSYQVIYGKGVDIIGPLMEAVIERGIIDNSSKGWFKFTYNGVEDKIQGKENLEKRFREDEDFRNYFGEQLGGTTELPEEIMVSEEGMKALEDLVEETEEVRELDGVSWDHFGQEGAP